MGWVYMDKIIILFAFLFMALFFDSCASCPEIVEYSGYIDGCIDGIVSVHEARIGERPGFDDIFLITRFCNMKAQVNYQ